MINKSTRWTLDAVTTRAHTRATARSTGPDTQHTAVAERNWAVNVSPAAAVDAEARVVRLRAPALPIFEVLLPIYESLLEV